MIFDLDNMNDAVNLSHKTILELTPQKIQCNIQGVLFIGNN